MKVFVLDQKKNPLMPTTQFKARKLIKSGRAVVTRRHPFTIRLKDRQAADSDFQSVRVKLDPGSRTTGVAIIREGESDQAEVLHFAELEHHGHVIKKALYSRKSMRRGRRTRTTRYRKPQFGDYRHPQNYRRKPKGLDKLFNSSERGWLPPSIESRANNMLHWINIYSKLLPVSAITIETVRFDFQKMANPEISGVEYQHGTLFGLEVKEYLLYKWDHKCVFCKRNDRPLEVEHILAKSKGGTNQVDNLTISCTPCNNKKSNRPIEEFLKDRPKLLAHILSYVKKPMKDAAEVNAIRWVIYDRVKDQTGLTVEMGSGGLTKYNRVTMGLPKTHYFDALSAGISTPESIIGTDMPVLVIKAVGRGRYRRKNSDKYGFPSGVHKRGRPPVYRNPDGTAVGHSPRARGKIKSNDFVCANIKTGKGAGQYTGFCVIRNKGNYKVKINGKVVAEGHRKYFSLIEPSVGYIFAIAVDRQIG